MEQKSSQELLGPTSLLCLWSQNSLLDEEEKKVDLTSLISDIAYQSLCSIIVLICAEGHMCSSDKLVHLTLRNEGRKVTVLLVLVLGALSFSFRLSCQCIN